VGDEHSQYLFEVSPVEDQEPVETFGAGGPDESLGDRVGLRRPNWCADDLEPFAGEYVVEAADELAVSVTDQEAQRH
jgi:hypothetical protein